MERCGGRRPKKVKTLGVEDWREALGSLSRDRW